MKNLKMCNIFFLILSLIQILPPTPIRLLLIGVVILISFFYLMKVNSNLFVPSYIKGLNFLLLLFTIYGIILIISSPIIRGFSGNIVTNSSYLTTIYLSLLPVYPVYYFSQRKELKEKDIKIWSIILLLLTTYSFFKLKNDLVFLAAENGVYVDDVTNNFGYSFLAFIPLIFIFKDKILLQYFILFYCLLFLLMSMKRGAIFIGIICLIIFFIASNNTLLQRQNKFKVICLSLLCLLGLFFVIKYFLFENEYFQYKLMDLSQGNSGRNELYSSIFEHYLDNQNVFQLLFGEGANASIKLSGNYAHNDWLEILINQGFLGALIYFVYWFLFFKTVRASNNSIAYYALLTIFISMLFKSFYSMSYAGVTTIEILSLGYFLAIQNTNSNSNK